MSRLAKLGLLFAAALAAALATTASAQSPICTDLQSQYLSALRAAGGQNTGRQMLDMEKVSRELANAQATARLGNCNRFLFFGPRPSPQCPAINAAIGRLQRQLAQMRGQTGYGFLARSPEFEQARLRDWLTQNGCEVPSLGGNRTICVRTCDGYYFPISFSASRSQYVRDDAVCQSMYAQAGQASLFVHNNGGDVANAVAPSGGRYADQPFAFQFRSAFSPACAAELKDGIAALGVRYWAARGPEKAKIAEVAGVVIVPRPNPRPGDRQEDPETIANRVGSLAVAPHVPEGRTATAVASGTIRQVGDAYYAELFDPTRAVEPKAHRPPLGYDLIGAALAMEAEEAAASGGQELPR